MNLRVALLSLLIALAACSSVSEGDVVSLEGNDMAYRLRYTDVSASLEAARQAYDSPSASSDDKAEALNNMAYVAYQQMRYDQALHLLRKVYASSRNQLELLCADVLRMKVMQRIGLGKSFFNSRLRAQKRLNRILSEESSLTERQKRRLHYALTEFHIVASTYYFYLGQDSAARHEIQEAAQFVNLEADTTQWLYYHYMMGSGGLVEGTLEEVTITEFDHLIRVYTLARTRHFTYFEANALQSFSAMIADSLRADLLKRQRLDAYSYLYEQHKQWQTDSTLSSRYKFAAALSHHSVALFREYRDLFQTACALRTLGEVYFSAGHYEEAFESFRFALHLASDHRRSPYQVKPWLAAIHENLSLTYSALGDKALADSHRNTYLDLLDQSRQDRELDSRKALLGQEARSEQMQFLLLLLLVIVVAVLAATYYRQLNNRSRSFERKVREISSSEDCQQAWQRLQALQQEGEERLEEGREACEVIRQRIQQQQQHHIFGRTKLSAVYAIIPYLDRVIAEVRSLNKGDGNAAEHLNYIQELCSGIMAINERLTEWIQMQQGRLKLQVTRFPLSEVLKVISMQQYAFAQQKLTLIVPETNVQVKADKVLTLFMINTLVDNARKFTPAGGKVAIEVYDIDNVISICVKDTGIGLSPEDVRVLNDSKVYDPTRIGMKNASKGFGFGIMNCKGIINSYKKLSSIFNVCDFGVNSVEGKGSCFWFHLPKVASMLLLFFALSLSAQAVPPHVRALFDSTYTANLEGRYDDACRFASTAIQQVEAPIDTSLLIALYNEQAIAAQAIGRWDVYRKSNSECVRLHRLYSSDQSLADDCRRIEKMTADSRVLYVLIVLLLIASLALFYMVVLRHRLRHRASMDDLYQRLTSALQSFPKNKATFADELQAIICSLEQPQLQQSVQQLQQQFSSGLARLQEIDNAIEDFEEKEQRQRFEHDRLYVMNQILDNSLSTIKHETMYFPSRIKQMAQTLSNSSSLLDLVTYYRHIYMLLYEQAQRQTDQSLLHLKPFDINDIFLWACDKYSTSFTPTANRVVGDKELIRMFFDQMLSMGLKVNGLSSEERDGMTYVHCRFYRPEFTPEQLSNLFSSQTERMEFLVMREIIREHDAALGHPGLRLSIKDDSLPKYIITFTLPTPHSSTNT